MTKEELAYEEKLVREAQRDRQRFAALYEKYFHQVFLFCYNRVNDQALAADLCSQTFLKAMLHLGGYRFRGVPFGAWLIRIASNEVNQVFRKSKKQREVSLDEEQMRKLSTDVDVEDSEENRQLLVRALNLLSLEESQLLELRFFEGYSFAEIAEVYNISEASVKMRVYRILKRMKRAIHKMDRK